ncbi:hypothetical protein C3Z13_00355 [Avibacterium endocarditidis]|uniref:Uncharacterized protein n=1 Tax=Avibacterium endocarditidis TaxID=380674 RepID=A0ABX4ZUH6_9PAST|nr:hypothetical protein C3Z13_00355 [Avibacterium endocarditidis]
MEKVTLSKSAKPIKEKNTLFAIIWISFLLILYVTWRFIIIFLKMNKTLLLFLVFYFLSV